MSQTVPFLPKRALLSVSDKRGIVDLAIVLHKYGVELVATGNTSKLLQENHLPVTDVSGCTGFPELLEGRVKTLHPAIHAGLLAADTKAIETLEPYHIKPFDVLVVNLYPFEAVTQTLSCTLENAIEHIDIGGPAMIRAAAKNYQRVGVIVTPDDYSRLTQYLIEQRVPKDWHFTLAQKAFAHTANYDTSIANYFNRVGNSGSEFPVSVEFLRGMRKQYDLRYGENPHQQAALYSGRVDNESALACAELLQGKPLSYNNLLDADAALAIVRNFPKVAQVCAIIKHGNPCGIASCDKQMDAYLRAYKTDSVSSYGGILAFNHVLELETVEAMFAQQFIEVIVAPALAPGVLEFLKTKENIRVLLVNGDQKECSWEVRSIDGGLLVQDRDDQKITEEGLEVVTTHKPNARQMQDLLFAWRAVKSVKSNAIVLAKDTATIGIGAGQTSRVMSARIALWQAKTAELSTAGAVMASDAFIPFSDSIALVQEQGVTAIIQPGGSIRDEDMICFANDKGLVMVFTNIRHFKH